MKKRGSLSVMWFLLVVAALGIVLWPLVKPGFFVSDDGEWMVIRLSAFYQSLRLGQFPVRFLGRLNNNYGYPVANFLYPGFMYIGSLIHAVGFSFVSSVKLLFALSIVGAAASIFLWLRTKFTKLASSIGVLAFVLAPYLFFDVYSRGSVGEVVALLPAALGFYSLASRKKWLFSLAVGFLIVSHNTLAMMFIGIYVLAILFLGLYEFFLSLAVGIGMAGFFWLPAFFEQNFVAFGSIVVSNPNQYFVAGGNMALIGIAGLVAWALLILKKRKKVLREDIFLLIVFAGCTLMATQLSFPVWSWKLLSRLVQFPYRFLAPAIVIAPWFFASVLDEIAIGAKVVLTIFFLIIWGLFLLPAMGQIAFVNRPEGYYTTNEATTTVADEYMPRWVSFKPAKRAISRIEFVLGRGTIQADILNSQRIRATIVAGENSVLQINTIYYPGWGAILDGFPVAITYANPLGVMRIAVPEGRHVLLAEFRETPARLLADFISVASMAAWGFLTLRWAKRKT